MAFHIKNAKDWLNLKKTSAATEPGKFTVDIGIFDLDQRWRVHQDLYSTILASMVEDLGQKKYKGYA